MFKFFTEFIFHYSVAIHHFIFFVLLVLSIIAGYVFFNRFFFFKNLSHTLPETNLPEYLSRTKFDELSAYQLQLPKTQTAFLNLAFDHIKNFKNEGLSEILDSATLKEQSRARKSLSMVAFVAANAPFVGLLGTVAGIMDSFRSLAVSSSEANQVMSGISEALIATFLGLFVAIVAVGVYNFYQNKIKSYMEELNTYKLLLLAKAKTK